MDLFYLGDVALKRDEKFKILRPVTHEMTDHFKENMLRSVSSAPGEKLYIDENGFRHKWKLIEEKSSRKSAISIIENNKEKNIININQNNITPIDVIDSKTNKHTYSLVSALKENVNNSSNTTKKKYRPKRKKKELEISPEIVDQQKTDLREAKERTMVKTTFFCPFIGVITMHSYLD